jgi:hypothetical protein
MSRLVSNPRRLACSMAAVGGLWMLAQAASAQTIGHYEGTTSQGNLMSIDVVDDGSGGTAFGGGLVFWQATCSKSGPGRNVAWGVGTNQPFSGNKVNAEFSFNMLYEKWKLTFSGNSVSGTFLGRTPEFTDVSTSTKAVELCDSGSLSFSANLVAEQASSRLPAPGQAVPVAR